MNILFVFGYIGFALIFVMCLAPILDFRRRPLDGTIGTCAFGKIPDPPPAHVNCNCALDYLEAA